MAAESKATTVWEGNLFEGRGTTNPASSAIGEVEVTWGRRTERTDDATSPEELLAAAHSSCFCMALSNVLDEAGNPPERLEATATVGFVPGEGVSGSHIEVRGRVPGIDQQAFEQAAQDAGKNCPISQALAIEITVDATLEG